MRLICSILYHVSQVKFQTQLDRQLVYLSSRFFLPLPPPVGAFIVSHVRPYRQVAIPCTSSSCIPFFSSR
jgi:hypothetical protein